MSDREEIERLKQAGRDDQTIVSNDFKAMDAAMAELKMEGKLKALQAMSEDPELTILKESGDRNRHLYEQTSPTQDMLEWFGTPECVGRVTLKIEVPEFTSLCPKTGQPDFAKIIIYYTPDKRCVESKSLKIYMGAFRNTGAFHESIVAMICDDLVEKLDPIHVQVIGEFSPRGGIPFHPTAEYIRPCEGQSGS